MIARYGEVFLKSDFVKKRMRKILVDNIKHDLQKNGIDASVCAGDIIRIYTNSVKKTETTLKRTFGIVSFSSVFVCKKDMDDICTTAKSLAKNFSGTFAIEAKRSDKSFPYTSQDIERIAGKAIADTGLKVNLTKPKNKIYIDVRDECHVYSNVNPGPGGLPLGSGGMAIGFSDNLLANWLMMKRGVKVVLVGKDRRNYKKLKKWNSKLSFHKINKIQDISKIAKKQNIRAVIYDKPVKNLLSLNPLVGFSEKEIRAMKRLI
ncbi:MAG: THUMP domain-containing protein [Candidatus Aenigmatarchaeota archaeon]